MVLRPEGREAGAAVAWLRARRDVSAIGLIGHGEGGRTAAAEAARDSDIRLVVLLAVPVRSVEEILLERMDRQLRVQGTPEAACAEILARQRSLFETIRNAGGDYLEIDERKTFIGALRTRLAFDLVETLKQVDAPVAILCGSEDSCIGAEDGDRLSRALPEVKQIRFEGLGHGFGRPLDKGFLGRLAGIVRGSLE